MFNLSAKNKVVVCCIALAGVFSAGYASAKLTGSLSEEAIAKRLAPYAKVEVEGAAQAQDKKASTVSFGPEQIYKKNCAMCHATGLAGAPRMGNKSDWAARIAQGKDVLLKHSIEGFKAMPPKGNCLKCSEDDLRQTIDYMTKGI